MKFNKWTLGLATVGVVSLASVVTARADMNPVQSAAESLSISGAVDTSIDWSLHPSGNDFGGSPGAFIPYNTGKQDGFNLNKVKLIIEKPLDESEWAAGGKAEFWFGPDANGIGTTPSVSSPAFGTGSGDFAIKQAYVALRAPVGNGLEFKIGVFDTIIGYEASNRESNPNYTHSWGYAIEPTQHEGILATYRFSDLVSASVGVANTWSAAIGDRNTSGTPVGGLPNDDAWCKTWMGSIALTAPESWGALAGSTLYGGIVYGFDAQAATDERVNYYAGAVVNTPVEGLTTGIAFDYTSTEPFGTDVDIGAIGLYASYRATEKLSFHGRAEYVWFDAGGAEDCGHALTGTVQYDLWANVISRLELRYDHAGDDFPLAENESWLAAMNIIYTF